MRDRQPTRLGGREGGGRESRDEQRPGDEADEREPPVDGRGPWRGWYEVAGAEAVTLAELRDLAAHTAGGTRGGAWEPPLEEIREHRLAEPQPWAAEFGIAPAPLASWAGATVA